MRMNDAFPSKFLKAADLNGVAVKVVISSVTFEDIGDDAEKPVMRFEGKAKGLVLNITNAKMVEAYHGEEMDNWAGKQIELYPTKTSFRGEVVDCLRIRVEAPPPPAAAEEGDEGEVPF